jgi:hypothetical protein
VDANHSTAEADELGAWSELRPSARAPPRWHTPLGAGVRTAPRSGGNYSAARTPQLHSRGQQLLGSRYAANAQLAAEVESLHRAVDALEDLIFQNEAAPLAGVDAPARIENVEQADADALARTVPPTSPPGPPPPDGRARAFRQWCARFCAAVTTERTVGLFLHGAHVERCKADALMLWRVHVAQLRSAQRDDGLALAV